jgi:hypothetical protein
MTVRLTLLMLSTAVLFACLQPVLTLAAELETSALDGARVGDWIEHRVLAPSAPNKTSVLKLTVTKVTAGEVTLEQSTTVIVNGIRRSPQTETVIRQRKAASSANATVTPPAPAPTPGPGPSFRWQAASGPNVQLSAAESKTTTFVATKPSGGSSATGKYLFQLVGDGGADRGTPVAGGKRKLKAADGKEYECTVSDVQGPGKTTRRFTCADLPLGGLVREEQDGRAVTELSSWGRGR